MQMRVGSLLANVYAWTLPFQRRTLLRAYRCGWITADVLHIYACTVQAFHGVRELLHSDHSDIVDKDSLICKARIHSLKDFEVRQDFVMYCMTERSKLLFVHQSHAQFALLISAHGIWWSTRMYIQACTSYGQTYMNSDTKWHVLYRCFEPSPFVINIVSIQ